MPEKNYYKREKRVRRHKHFMKNIRGHSIRPRLIIFRSNKHIYAQIVDDTEHKTLCAASTQTKDIQQELSKAKGKLERAKIVGQHIAKIAQEKELEIVVFDRNGFLYHGRVKALADGAREGGLQF